MKSISKILAHKVAEELTELLQQKYYKLDLEDLEESLEWELQDIFDELLGLEKIRESASSDTKGAIHELNTIIYQELEKVKDKMLLEVANQWKECQKAFDKKCASLDASFMKNQDENPPDPEQKRKELLKILKGEE